MGKKVYIQEDEADRWLREHDPYYKDKNGHKRKKAKYPYETPRQERTHSEKEIAFSNLTGAQRRQLKDVLGDYDEDGNFTL